MINLKNFNFTKDDYEWYFEECFEGAKKFKNSGYNGYLGVHINSTAQTETPKDSQQNALDYFLANEEKVLNNLCKGIIDFFYSEKSIIYTEHFKFYKEKENFEVFNSIADVKKHISLFNLHLDYEEKNGFGYIGIDCSCPWDEEHGLGVVLYKETVINIGNADVAIFCRLD